MRKEAIIVCAVLLLQAGGLLLLPSEERVPEQKPLAEFPEKLGPWEVTRKGVIEDRIREVLQADDAITWFYGAPGRPELNLYIAYFRSQRTGKAPHSPKNCLPGSGWAPTQSGELRIPIPGRPEPITVNRYIVEKGDAASLVLYWYQSRDRVVASEYWAKIYLVLDALRYRRSDTALIRVVVPLRDHDVAAATETAVDFVQQLFPQLLELPQFQPAVS